MNKIAQRRSRLNKLREKLDFTGRAAETFFQPQLAEVMDRLRTVDSNVRSMVAGTQIEGGDPGVDRVALKDLLKSAKNNIAKMEFMAAIADLGRFHKKFYEIKNELASLSSTVDQVHDQFLFQDMGDEQKKQLRDLRERWQAKAAAAHAEMVKEAGLLDFFKHMLSDRGKAMRYYKGRYPKKVEQLQVMTKNVLKDSERMLNVTLSTLKEMASHRAVRNPEAYMKAAEKIFLGFKGYDTRFKEYYDNNIKDLIEKTKSLEEPITPVEIAKDPFPASEAPITDKEPGHVTVVPSGSEPATVMPTGTTVPAPATSGVPTTPAPARAPGDPLGSDLMGYLQKAQELQNTTPTTPAPALESGTQSVAPAETMMGVAPPANPPKTQFYAGSQRQLPPMLSHGQFWESLQAMSGEHPAILRSYIRKYAQGIQVNDPATAVKLLQIARSIKG